MTLHFSRKYEKVYGFTMAFPLLSKGLCDITSGGCLEVTSSLVSLMVDHAEKTPLTMRTLFC